MNLTVRSIRWGFALTAALLAGEARAGLIVNRGLPSDNLNNVSGANRSNVAWGFSGNFFAGDNFVLPPGNWTVDTLRTWTVAGRPGDSSILSFLFDSVTLYGGVSGGPIAALQSGNFIDRTNTTDNAAIQITPVTYPGGENYQFTLGEFGQLYQVDFTGLALELDGGVEYDFGIFGDGDIWFSHASNAALSGTPQQGANDLYRFFSTDFLPDGGGDIDSNGFGFNKSTDVNVQVFATQNVVPEPSGVAVAVTAGLFAIGLVYFRRRGAVSAT